MRKVFKKRAYSKPVPLAGNDRAAIQLSIQEREDAPRSNARVVSVELMMHSSRLATMPAKKIGTGG